VSDIYVVYFNILFCILLQQLNGRMLVQGTMLNMIRDLIFLGSVGNKYHLLYHSHYFIEYF
jgi:hypothetical protein